MLGLVVTTYIFYCLDADSDQSIEPDQLACLRSVIVQNDTLAFAAVCKGLHKHLHHNSTMLQNLINSFVVVRFCDLCYLSGTVTCAEALMWQLAFVFSIRRRSQEQPLQGVPKRLFVAPCLCVLFCNQQGTESGSLYAANNRLRGQKYVVFLFL